MLSISPCALLFSVGQIKMPKEARIMKELSTNTIDDLGRILLPKEFRNAHGWEAKTKVTIYQDSDALILKLSDGTEETA